MTKSDHAEDLWLSKSSDGSCISRKDASAFRRACVLARLLIRALPYRFTVLGQQHGPSNCVSSSIHDRLVQLSVTPSPHVSHVFAPGFDCGPKMSSLEPFVFKRMRTRNMPPVSGNHGESTSCIPFQQGQSKCLLSKPVIIRLKVLIVSSWLRSIASVLP